MDYLLEGGGFCIIFVHKPSPREQLAVKPSSRGFFFARSGFPKVSNTNHKRIS